METTFKHDELSPATTLREAKRLVAIATAGENDVLSKALLIIQQRIMEPGTCAHPAKKISVETKKLNAVIRDIYNEVYRLRSDGLPF